MSYSIDKKSFFTPDEKADGAKGLVFIGDKLLVLRRDTNTRIFPLAIDLPGGGKEPGETPFETFRREAREEFGLEVEPEDVVEVYHYDPEMTRDEKTNVAFPMSDYFPIVKLPETQERNIQFGDEGVEYMFMTLDEYLDAPDAVPAYQKRAAKYAEDGREN